MPLLLMVSGVALCHTCCTVPYGVDWPCCSCPIHPAPVLLCPAMRREPPSPSKIGISTRPPWSMAAWHWARRFHPPSPHVVEGV